MTPLQINLAYAVTLAAMLGCAVLIAWAVKGAK